MLNKAEFIGRLTKDPERSQSSRGTTFANFTLAINRGIKNEDEVDYPRITATGKRAELVSEYLTKGCLVYVDCSYRTWKDIDEKGKTRYLSGLYLNKVEFLSKPKSKDFNESEEERSIAEREAIKEFVENEKAFEEVDENLPF